MSEFKKVLYNNIIKFTIGIVLLVFCGTYLSIHQAEKISLFSSLDILRDKAKVMTHNIIGNQGNTLQKKYAILRDYEMLMGEIEQNKCFTPTKREEIAKYFETIKTMNADTFTKKQYLIQIEMGNLQQTMKETCKK